MATEPPTSLHLTTRVGPGGKISIETPRWAEGKAVEVFVVAIRPDEAPGRTVLDFLDSVAIEPRSASGWREFEARFREKSRSRGR